MAPDQELRKNLAIIASLDVGMVKAGEPLRNHSSWRIGGPADLLVEPTNIAQMVVLVKAVAEARVPLVVIGRGSNILFSDQGVRGVVLKIGAQLAAFAASGNRVVAGAGIWVPKFSRLTARAGISGFEHAVGIPGTLGGLVLMNGGSQRKSIGANVTQVRGVTLRGERVSLTREECDFSYRHSRLQDDRIIVTEVELEGTAGDPKEVRGQMLGILRERRAKFPLKQPNCGSVFLSTPELHAAFGPPGRIIEGAGLKGVQMGGAEVSTKHANFIVNRGSAKASEVLSLIRNVREQVSRRYGVDLCCEVRYVTPAGETLSADRACELQEGWAAP